MSKMLVTGGLGFIGTYVCSELSSLGLEVIALDARRPYALPSDKLLFSRETYLRKAMTKGLRSISTDLLDTGRLIDLLAIEQPKVVIHLAANPLVAAAHDNPLGCRRDIVESTESLMQAILAAGCVERVVYVSSSMVYGNFSHQSDAEDGVPEPINAYGRMKLEAENLVRSNAEISGSQFVIVRPMAVYGPGDYHRRIIPNFCKQALAGEVLHVNISPDTLIDFTFVSDIAEGIALAALHPNAAREVFNMTFGQARTLDELIGLIRREVPNVEVEWSCNDRTPRPSRGTLDIRKAGRMLGYSPKINLEAGLDCLFSFLKQDVGIYSQPIELVRPVP